MFTIFNRKKKVVVDCFTYNLPAFEFVPIVKANQALPVWWKTLPNLSKVKTLEDADRVQTDDPDNHNMKRCYGLLELYKRGAMIRNWSDIVIENNGDQYDYVYSNGIKPTFHPKSQYNNAFKNFNHIKLSSPWFLREKTGIPFLQMGACWNNDDVELYFLNGVMTYDVHAATAINVMMPVRDKPYTIQLEIGRPLSHLIPLRDDLDVEFKCHYTTQEECFKMDLLPRASLGSSYSLLKLIKNNKEQSKCPF